MARKEKKQPKKTVQSKKGAQILRPSFLNSKKDLLSSPQSYKSLFFGIATVIILFLIGFGITRLFLADPKPSINGNAVSTENLDVALQNSQKYTVKLGDTLWSIAEEKYGSGFEWYKIAEANNISDSTTLEEGTELQVPQVVDVPQDTKPTESEDELVLEESIQEDVAEPQIPTSASITGSSYKVQEGDSLWDIAVRAYGDGYKWVEIASVNSLENPDFIHPENTLTLPR